MPAKIKSTGVEKPDIKKYRETSHFVMGVTFASYHKFVTDSLSWLSERYCDVQVEFHKEIGWQVSTCRRDGGGWGGLEKITGDGTLPGCLLEAVLVIGE